MLLYITLYLHLEILFARLFQSQASPAHIWQSLHYNCLQMQMFGASSLLQEGHS